MPAILLRLETLAWAAAVVLFAAFAADRLWIMLRPLADGMLGVNDFVAQWTFARFAWDGHAADIYDAARLNPFQHRLVPVLRHTFPYPYPPSFLLYILPLGGLSAPVASLAWMGGTLALYLAAAWPRGGGWLARALVVAAPAVACCLAYGQNGLLTAALLLGGFRLLPARPVLAGIAFGLLSFKPQFGVLVPVALVAAGQWRCLAAGAATLVVLVVASGAAFGWALWTEWFAYLPYHADYVDSAMGTYSRPTLQAALQTMGYGPLLARGVPLVVLALSVPVVWWAFRARRALAPAILVAATFAGAPYAFIYDLPALGGVAVCALAARPAGAWRLADDAIIGAALAIPATMTLTTRFYWTSGVILVLLLALVTLRARAPG
jgi:hypothetical protein